MSVKLTTREVGNVTILDIEGKLTLGEGSGAFRDKIRELLTSGKKKILLNFEQTTWTDSSGMGELISSFVSVTNSGGQLKTLAYQKQIEDLLIITKLYTVFETFNDEKAAVESFAD